MSFTCMGVFLLANTFLTDWHPISAETLLSCPIWEDDRFEMVWLDSKCFMISQNFRLDWKGSFHTCEENDVILLKLNVRMTAQMLTDQLDRVTWSEECYWSGRNEFMGDTDPTTAGVWQWTDRSDASVVYPDEEFSDAWDENCGALCKLDDNWHVVPKPCDSEYAFICQYDPCPIWTDGDNQWRTVIEDKCYVFSQNKYTQTWDTANKLCQANNQQLLRFSTLSYQAFYDYIPSMSTQMDEMYWIDRTGQDKGQHASWRYELSLTDIDAYNLTESECIILLYGRSEAMEQGIFIGLTLMDCISDYFFICQKDVTIDYTTESRMTTRPEILSHSTTSMKQDIRKDNDGSTAIQIKVARLISRSIRLTASPTWTTTATQTTSCARKCQRRTPQCDLFNFNQNSFSCRCYLSDEMRELGPEHANIYWAVWKFDYITRESE